MNVIWETVLDVRREIYQMRLIPYEKITVDKFGPFATGGRTAGEQQQQQQVGKRGNTTNADSEFSHSEKCFQGWSHLGVKSWSTSPEPMSTTLKNTTPIAELLIFRVFRSRDTTWQQESTHPCCSTYPVQDHGSSRPMWRWESRGFWICPRSLEPYNVPNYLHCDVV